MSQAEQKPVKEFARELSDTYATIYYRGGWSDCITMLRARAYTDREIEAIIRSKWARWAADVANKGHGKAVAADLANFLDDEAQFLPEGLRAQLDGMVRERFHTRGADSQVTHNPIARLKECLKAGHAGPEVIEVLKEMARDHGLEEAALRRIDFADLSDQLQRGGHLDLNTIVRVLAKLGFRYSIEGPEERPIKPG